MGRHLNCFSKNLTWIFISLVAGVLSHCSSLEQNQAENLDVVGSYAAYYDAATGNVDYVRIDPLANDSQANASSPHSLTIGNDTSGVLSCAIIDHSLNPGDVNYCLGLVDPDSCSTDYNTTTRTLSFYTELRNRSNLPNDYDAGTNPTGTEYTDLTNFPLNQTYLGPFYFFLTGIVPVSPAPADLVEAVNTNIPTAECGGDGLSVADSSDDANDDDRFDCIYPEYDVGGAYPMYNYSKSDYPGWNFTPVIPGNSLTPGETSGCNVFFQFTLKSNQSFIMYFDVVAIRDDGSLPSTPNVTSHSDGQYVNTTPLTISGNNCTNGATVYIEGGTSVASGACSGGSFSISTPLNLNQANNLSVYQIDSGKQSGSLNLTIHHDNIAPTVVSASPSNGSTSVDPNINCVITFSEAMDTTTFAANITINPAALNTVTASSDGTQAILNPNTSLAYATNYTCSALTGVTDLAGNALAAQYDTQFTTIFNHPFFEDFTPPYVRAFVPPDNATIPPETASFNIFFNEPMDPATLVGSVVDPACDLSGRNIPTVFMFELSSCNGGNGQPVPGTTSLSADGKIATFSMDPAYATYPNLKPNNCYGFVIQSCVADLAGNNLPSRGNRNIGAYNGGATTYNAYNVFFTTALGSDSTGPQVVHVGPVLDATAIHERILSRFVFNEPLSPSTIITNYFYMTEFGDTTKIPLSLSVEPFLQMVTLDPPSSSTLDPNTVHVITATGKVADVLQNEMSAPQTSQFTTVTSGNLDTTGPTVVTTSPANGGTSSTCMFADIWFSEPMDVNTLTSSNVSLILQVGATSLVKPTTMEISDDGMHVRLIPDSNLLVVGPLYRIFVSQNVTDRAGNNLSGGDFTSTFSALADAVVPSVSSVVPPNGSNISRNASFLINFSEPMDKSTLIASRFTITGCTPIIYAAPDGSYVIANCINQMGTGNRNLTVNRNVRDYYNPNNFQSCEAGVGNRMAANQVFNYTVTAGNDTTQPTVNSVNPTHNSTAALGVSPTITFSEALDPRTVTSSTVFLMDQQGNLVSADVSLDSTATIVTINPVSNLLNDTIYYIVASTAIRDLTGGNAYDGDGGGDSVSGVLRTCFATGSATCP